ncbi:MAG TPA: DUF4832 domain-containing protein [Tepidisphaeraceae bacterium]|nr:DUF4832 domain-containing protein [Tepidisphaeraceae bacterium]
MIRGILLALLILFLSLRAGAEPVTVVPKENPEAVLSNPDMGWVVYENYPLDPRPGGSSTLVALPDETFPHVDSVALMFAWSDVEMRDGHYDFSKVDFAYDHWRKKGKRIQLRMSSESLLWWNHLDPPSGLGVPPYVLERMPETQKQSRTESGRTYVVVDARNPFYRERLARFLNVIAEHFGADRPVQLVDLRGFGLWGEWHTGFRYAWVDDRREALKHVIDVYSAAFPDHWVSLSASYDPDSPKELWDGPTKHFDPAFTKTYQPFLRYSAFDHALTKPNVTFRRDGAGGAVHSNERKLIEEAFATRSRGPFMSEFVDGYANSMKGGQKWVRWKIVDALSLHPNYVNLLGWQSHDALNFLKEQPALIDYGLRTMGYRLVPMRVTYPSHFRAGERLRIDSEWINRGVGRAMRDYRLHVTLTKAGGKVVAGKVVASADAGELDTDSWIKGKTYMASNVAVFTGVAPGLYRLHLSLIDPESGTTINLPLHDRRDDGSYPIGAIRCRQNP